MRSLLLILVVAAVLALAAAVVTSGRVTAAPADAPAGWKWGDDGRSNAR